MNKLNRRGAIALGSLAPIAWTLPTGGEIDSTSQGINIKLFWTNGKWHVIVPDIENRGPHWTPGMALPFKYELLDHYLGALEEFFGLKPKRNEI